MEYSASTPESIQSLFNAIAKRYDRMNGILSFGLYRLWNRRLIASVAEKRQLLDLCAGTGAISCGVLKKNPETEAVLLDFSSQMLAVAKMKSAPFSNRCTFCEADAQKIPFPDESFDAITLAYGLRNIHDPTMCIKEACRVLKKGGLFAILELTRPEPAILRSLHSFFLKTSLPLLGKLLAENEAAYRYLCQSIHQFVHPKQIREILLSSQFSSVKITPLSFGVATLLVAKK